MLNIKIKVLSVEGSTRRPKMQKYLEEKHLPFEFFDAAYSSNIKRNGDTFEYKQSVFSINTNNNFPDSFKGRGWVSIGELGCLLSHYSMWKELIISDNIDAFIILEDDAKPLFTGMDINNFCKTQKLTDVDIISCQRTSPNSERKYRDIFDTLSDNIQLVESDAVKTVLCEGTAGYIITKKGAEKLTRIIETYDLIFTVDNFIWRCSQVADLKLYITTKTIQVDLCPELSEKSTIHIEHAKDIDMKNKIFKEKLNNGIYFLYTL